MNGTYESKVTPDKPKEQGELCSKELLGATVTVNNKYRVQLPPEPKFHIIAIVKSKLPECFRGYWLMRLMPDGTDEKTADMDAVKDGDKFWAIPPCGFCPDIST
jgi:hypothetical protein